MSQFGNMILWISLMLEIFCCRAVNAQGKYSLGQIPLEPESVRDAQQRDRDSADQAKTDASIGQKKASVNVIDEVSVTMGLRIASAFGDETDGRLVLDLQFPEAAHNVELISLGKEKSLTSLREKLLQERFGDRVVYDPDFPLRGPVASIRIKPSELQKTIKEITRTFPQVEQVSVRYQQIALTDAELGKLPEFPLVKSFVIEASESWHGSEEAGVTLLSKQQSGLCQVLIDDEKGMSWIVSQTSPQIRFEAAQILAADGKIQTINNLPEYSIWLRKTPKEQAKAAILQLDGQIEYESDRKITFRISPEQIAALQKAGLDPEAVP